MSHEHNFVELPSSQKRRGYFKRLPDGSYDQTISYAMLYCTTCGETREIVASDNLYLNELPPQSRSYKL